MERLLPQRLMTIVAVFSSPNFWTWLSLETWRHHVFMSCVSLTLALNRSSLGFDTSMVASSMAAAALLCNIYFSLISLLSL
jgi:hypothetical protein